MSIDEREFHPFPQLDGPDDILLAPHPVLSSAAPVSHRYAPYTLNQQKQVSKLIRDASIPDFSIEELDSGRILNVKCNTGFYEAVAKPAFSSLSQGFRHQASDVSIICTVKRNTLDSGSSLSGLLLRFELSGPGVQPNPAPLSVHLHNTQRKIQVQGGACMPDKTTAALWFIQNILKERFVSQAKGKKFNIEAINKAVVQADKPDKMAHTHPLDCSHCGKRFTNGSRPVVCSKFSFYKHKTKCITLSRCPALTRPSTLNPPSPAWTYAVASPSVASITVSFSLSTDPRTTMTAVVSTLSSSPANVT